MKLLIQFAKKLVGREENILLGLWFLLFCRRYRTEFGTFHLPLTFSKCHFYARFLTNSYEIEERTLIKQHLDPHDNVLELGGCAGIVSCLTAQIIKDGRHCVLEANPEMLSYLYRNREHNRADFVILGLALSKDQKTLPFYIHKNMVGGSSLRQTSRKTNVACLPFKQVNSRYGPFDVLIMDIEGGEAGIIEENEKELAQFKKLIVEFHPTILGEERVTHLHTQLRSLGFKCVSSLNTVSCFRKED